MFLQSQCWGHETEGSPEPTDQLASAYWARDLLLIKKKRWTMAKEVSWAILWPSSVWKPTCAPPHTHLKIFRYLYPEMECRLLRNICQWWGIVKVRKLDFQAELKQTIHLLIFPCGDLPGGLQRCCYNPPFLEDSVWRNHTGNRDTKDLLLS